jgi:hypothetical protein
LSQFNLANDLIFGVDQHSEVGFATGIRTIMTLLRLGVAIGVSEHPSCDWLAIHGHQAVWGLSEYAANSALLGLAR